jgi:putative flavoprotein involved in K+ transport
MAPISGTDILSTGSLLFRRSGRACRHHRACRFKDSTAQESNTRLNRITLVSRKEVIVVGAGSAGLATSWHLTRLGVDHAILERAAVGHTWEAHRWDTFRLVLPNRMFDLPGYPYDGDDPDGFMARREIVGRFGAYAESFGAPVRAGIDVGSLESAPAGYRLRTSSGEIQARIVVVATGAYQRPWVPPLADDLSSRIYGVHSDHYRNPDQIPPGGVLVIGGGQSGVQIAEELCDAGRDVWLSIGSCSWLPRRYRGKDMTGWLEPIGFIDQTVESLPSPAARFACWPQNSGQNGGHDLNPRRLAAKGVHLLGRALGCDGGAMAFSVNALDLLRKADEAVLALKRQIDAYIDAHGIDAPPEEPRQEEEATIPLEKLPAFRPSIDLAAEGIRSVIWATGFHPSFGWIRLPIFDEHGYPRHRRGISDAPGLYFMGLQWLHKRKSSIIPGVGEDAAFIADHIDRRLNGITA